MFSLTNKPFLGVDIGSSSVKLALLKGSAKGFELLNFGMAPLPPDTIVEGEVENPEAVTEVIKKLLKSEKIPTSVKYCCFAGSGPSAISQTLTVPHNNAYDLADTKSDATGRRGGEGARHTH